VNRLATPETQGFDGSEKIRSNARPRPARAVRASAKRKAERSSSKGLRFAGRNDSDACTIAGSISIVVRLSRRELPSSSCPDIPEPWPIIAACRASRLCASSTSGA
jgi:hypothetical protein